MTLRTVFSERASRRPTDTLSSPQIPTASHWHDVRVFVQGLGNVIGSNLEPVIIIAVRFSNTSADTARFFTRRTESYARFIRVVLYPQGIRGYFLQVPFLRSGLCVLDAGCGTGAVTLALRRALISRGLFPGRLHGFDLTPAMLERFKRQLHAEKITDVQTAEADVLRLETLPGSWNSYDLIVSASMLEYVPTDRLVDALAGLRRLLSEEGRFVLFITRRNWLTRLLIGRWWQGHLYDSAELRESFRLAGFTRVVFGTFPFRFRHLAHWGYIIEARGTPPSDQPVR